MKIFAVPQLSDAWWAIRRGIPTSSDFDRIITPAKGDLSKSATKYIAQLIADVFCQTPNYFSEQGRPTNSYAIQNGIDTEPDARRWLAMDARLRVEEVGFCVSDDFSMGCSPDGMLGFNVAAEADPEPWRGHPYFSATVEATVELKCPLLATHAEYLLDGILPVEYRPQVHGHMVVTGAAAVEFVSYARGLPPLRVKVERDEYTDKVEKAVREFVGLYTAALQKVRQR